MATSRLPNRVTIPASPKEAIKRLNGLGALLNSQGWERAAIVYAFTVDQQGSNQHQSKVTDARLGINEFAALGIVGLKSHNTVQLYRSLWAEYGKAGIKPGDTVTLPKVDFPPTRTGTDGTNTVAGAVKTVERMTPEVRVAVAKHLLSDTATTTKAMRALPVEVTGAVLDAAVEVMDTHRLPTTPFPVSMAGSSVAADVSRHFMRAAREIERAVERLNEAIAHGTRFERFEFEGLAREPEAQLDPRLTVYRKTVAMVVTHEDEPA